MTDTKKPARKTTAKADQTFTEAERDAMKERAKELKASRGGAKADPEADVLAKIAEMPEPDRGMAQRIHDVIRSAAPTLAPRTWYGMPAYALDGKILCFFQPADKFKARYATFGFNDPAKLDDGSMWPTAFALTKLTDADAARIEELVRNAVG